MEWLYLGCEEDNVVGARVPVDNNRWIPSPSCGPTCRFCLGCWVCDIFLKFWLCLLLWRLICCSCERLKKNKHSDIRICCCEYTCMGIYEWKIKISSFHCVHNYWQKHQSNIPFYILLTVGFPMVNCWKVFTHSIIALNKYKSKNNGLRPTWTYRNGVVVVFLSVWGFSSHLGIFHS